MIASRHLIASSALLGAVLVAGGCGHKLPGGVPSAPSVPGGASGEVDPNTCGNYAASDAGARLKIFLQATKDLQDTTIETAKVLKQSCIMMGQQLQMADGDLAGDDTGVICNHVFDTIKSNLQVTLKAKAGIKIKFTPGQCTVDASASASAGGACSGGAGAGTGGAGAGGSCAASAQVNASIHAQCTPPQLDIAIASPKLVLDTSKLQLTIDAMKAGLPQIFSVSARIQPIKDSVTVWAQSAKDLASMGPKFVQSFGDQAMCISGQLGAVAAASTHIQANVSVSVSVSASASGTVGS